MSVLGTPAEELSKEEKNLAIMAMKKKDKRLYDRIMHSKKKKRSEVNYSLIYVPLTKVGQAGQSDKIEVTQRC